MWNMFISRSLMSISDSLFWVTIIFALGITIYLVSRGLLGYLLEEVAEETEEGVFLPLARKRKTSRWKEVLKSQGVKVLHWVRRKK